MGEKTTYLKLPFEFDEDKLLHDYSLILNKKWIPHFNTQGYKGNWDAISLYAPDGDGTNIYAFSTTNPVISETSALRGCNYFKEVIESFKCPVLTARLLRLSVGAKIKPHRDHELGYENNNFRLHIPITTNKGVQFVLDDNQLTMLAGECWYTNVNYIHSVANLGDSDRVHMVLDFERNDWSDSLFFSLAPEESFKPEPEQSHSPETVELIIEELKRHNEPASKQLIKELELKLRALKNKGL